jgi:hypothetical protein
MSQATSNSTEYEATEWTRNDWGGDFRENDHAARCAKSGVQPLLRIEAMSRRLYLSLFALFTT